MERADFMHLLRLSEQASAEDSAAYRRSVALFAALGYLWVVGSLLLALGILGWAGWQWHVGERLRGGHIWLVLMALGLLWASASALWLRLDAPEGLPITPRDAPALFALLKKIRRKTQGPPIHQVLLDGEFNAGIQQHPRFGLLGGSVNYLVIGLPMLMALDAPRLAAVLAHEYGHLRSDHGRFNAWVYRTRLAWERLYEHMQHSGNPMGWLTHQFLRWYAPRFSARTFALARQDEYEADRIAARMAGASVAAAALGDAAIKGAWLAQHFWPAHWRQAGRHTQPQGPYAAMQRLLAEPPAPDFARRAFRDELKRLPEVDDTHPGLRDRLQAMGQPLQPPPASAGPSALHLLAQPQRWIARLDKTWQRDNRQAWQRAHAWAQRVQQRIQQLQAIGPQASADELAEQARLMCGLDPDAPVTPLLERALRQTPAHAAALHTLAQHLPAHDSRRLPLLEQLHECSADHRWWAAREAVDHIERASENAGDWDEAALKTWRQRLKAAERVEDQAHDELGDPPYLARTHAHGLNALALDNLQHTLSQFADPIHSAWLVRKQLTALPQRRAWLLLLHAPKLDAPACWELRHMLHAALDLPGPCLILFTGDDLPLADIQRQHPHPIFGHGAR